MPGVGRSKALRSRRPKKSPRDVWQKWWDGLPERKGQPFKGLTYRETAALKQMSWECRWVIKERPKRVVLLLKVYMRSVEGAFTPKELFDVKRLIGEGKLGSSEAKNLPPIVSHSKWLGTDFTRAPKEYFLVANPERR